MFLYHGYLWQEQFAGAPKFLLAVIRNGSMSVSLFFVLSGFILSMRYLGDGSVPVDRRAFWLARFARIYPLYLAALVLSVPLMGVMYARALSWSLVPHALLLQAWSPSTTYAWNAPGWSLSAEAFFYATFPFLAPRLVGKGSPRRLAAGMLLLWLASWTTVVLLARTPPGAPDAVMLHPVFTFPLFRLPEFLMGVCVGRLYCRDVAGGRGRPGMAFVGVGALSLLVVLGLSAQVAKPLLDLVLVSPGFALIVYGLAHGGRFANATLGSRLFAALGAASYSLYILQQPLLDLAFLVAQVLGIERGPVWFAVSSAFVVGASYAAHVLLERPAQAWVLAASARSIARPPRNPGRPGT